MKAMVLTRPSQIETRPLVYTTVPDPEPCPGEIRVRVVACGVCHTDLHTAEGDLALPRLPIIPGHQIVGIVDALGPGALRFRPGDRVGIPWLGQTCGTCAHCRAGRENLCEAGRFVGLHIDGGFAEYTVIDEEFAHPLPAGCDDVEVTPILCGGVIGYRALRVCDVQRGEAVGLVGFGNSAHVTMQIARHWGCPVFVFTRSAAHRDLARRLGADWVGDIEDHPGIELDRAVVFAPAGWLVPLALGHLRKGGVLTLAGITMSAIPAMDYDLIYGERSIRSVANSTRRDVTETLTLAAEIPIRTDVQPFRLAQANEALASMKMSRLSGGAALVMDPPDTD